VTVVIDVALIFYAALSEVPARERRPRAADALDLVGLGAAARRRIGGFSGGMKSTNCLSENQAYHVRIIAWSGAVTAH
jgi:ABC-2 type transport system ATP-binding protein